MPRHVFRGKPGSALIENGVVVLVLTLLILTLARLAGDAVDRMYDATWLGVSLIS